MLTIDFNEYMTYDRFNVIMQFHILEVPDGKHQADPLYRIRSYLDAFNEILARSMELGRYLCADESVNQ
jgi:hypothetical protein